jgi:phosphoribosylformylglycinamidine (FGAM) synthase PurS component
VPKYDINLNLNESFGSGRTTANTKQQAVSIDEKALSGLSRTLVSVLNDQAKKISSALNSTIKNSVREINRSQKTSNIKIDEASLQKALARANEKIGKSIASSVVEAINKRPAGTSKGLSDTDIEKAVSAGLKSAASSIGSSVAREMHVPSKTDKFLIDISPISKAIENSLSKAFKQTGQDKATAELVRVLSGVRESLQKIDASTNKAVAKTLPGVKN